MVAKLRDNTREWTGRPQLPTLLTDTETQDSAVTTT